MTELSKVKYYFPVKTMTHIYDHNLGAYEFNAPHSHWLIQSSDEVARGGVHVDKDGGLNSKNDKTILKPK